MAMKPQNFLPDSESGESRVKVPTGVLSPPDPLWRKDFVEQVKVVNVFSTS